MDEPYSVGYFVVDGELHEVRGAAAVMLAARDTIAEAQPDGSTLSVPNPAFIDSTIHWDKSVAESVVTADGDVVAAMQADARAGVLADLTDEEYAIYKWGASNPVQAEQLESAMKRLSAAARKAAK